MYLFLILLGCAAVTEACGGPTIVGYISRNSRFGGFNSRLDRQKFPFGPATGIGLQDVDWACGFHGQTALLGAKTMNFPLQREKTAIGGGDVVRRIAVT
jgi:hypothetical protein